MLPMTWLLIFQDLWELEEVHVYWNVNKRTSPNIHIHKHTKDKRMRDTESRLDSAKAAIEGFLLAFGLPHAPRPNPKENIVQDGKEEMVVIWEIVRSPRRCGHHLVAGSGSASVRRVHGQKPPRSQAYPRTKNSVHSRQPSKPRFIKYWVQSMNQGDSTGMMPQKRTHLWSVTIQRTI